MFFYGKSDIGKKRTTNQDAFDIRELREGVLLLTVCDGMGGANGGNIASDLALRTFVDFICKGFSEECDVFKLLTDGVQKACSTVFEKAESDNTLLGMGTTLVSALIIGSSAFVVNVGDSRLYLACGKTIKQITKDHSFVQYLVDTGRLSEKEAETAPMKNVITRSVGNEKTTSPDSYKIELKAGCYLLLCSDGLTNCVKKEKMLQTIMKKRPAITKESDDIRHKVDRLVELANEGGGTDNITAILGII